MNICFLPHAFACMFMITGVTPAPQSQRGSYANVPLSLIARTAHILIGKQQSHYIIVNKHHKI